MTDGIKQEVREVTSEDLYTLLDDVLHAAMESCPDKQVVQAAEILHKEILEQTNFDLIKVRSSNPESKPLTDRLINAMYKDHNPYGDEEKGN